MLTLIGVWKKLIPTLMDDLKRVQDLSRSNCRGGEKELELKIKPDGVTELL